jgi:hypothetical protein
LHPRTSVRIRGHVANLSEREKQATLPEKIRHLLFSPASFGMCQMTIPEAIQSWNEWFDDFHILTFGTPLPIDFFKAKTEDNVRGNDPRFLTRRESSIGELPLSGVTPTKSQLFRVAFDTGTTTPHLGHRLFFQIMTLCLTFPPIHRSRIAISNTNRVPNFSGDVPNWLAMQASWCGTGNVLPTFPFHASNRVSSTDYAPEFAAMYCPAHLIGNGNTIDSWSFTVELNLRFSADNVSTPRLIPLGKRRQRIYGRSDRPNWREVYTQAKFGKKFTKQRDKLVETPNEKGFGNDGTSDWKENIRDSAKRVAVDAAKAAVSSAAKGLSDAAAKKAGATIKKRAANALKEILRKR